MKRVDLLRKIKEAAKSKGVAWGQASRKGSDHDVYECDGMGIPVPRHREINEYTAQGIMRDLEVKLGKDWWRK